MEELLRGEDAAENTDGALDRYDDGSAYRAIATVYDRLNAEIDYVGWADFVEECFKRFSTLSPTLLLDLACGTGRMTKELARRGYDMIGIDGSEEMLCEALLSSEGMGILYLLQDMRELELYGTVGGVTCCLDSLNYLLTEADLVKAVRKVRLYLEPGGLFLFDLNTPWKFERVYGDNAYVLETEIEDEEDESGERRRYPAYCGWQNAYDEESGLCDFYLSLFLADRDGRYQRSDERQTERCYGRETVEGILKENGFELCGVYGGIDFSPPTEETERWYFVARAVPGNTDQQVVLPEDAAEE